ncbi:MAG: hypothetical protein AB7S26_36000 [Sandaracinaceae bacterium]
MVRAFVVVVGIALVPALVPESASAQDAYDVDDAAVLAQRAFDRGLAALEAGDRERALDEFRASYDYRASPNSRLMVARILSELDRPAAAYMEYERVIAEARDRARSEPRFATTLAHAERERAQLEPRIGWVEIETHPPIPNGELHLDDRVVPGDATGEWLAVTPGRVVVTASADGFHDARATVEVAAGERQRIVLELEALPDARAPVDPEPAPGGWPQLELGVAGTAVGGLALLVGAVLIGAAYALLGDLQGQCPGGTCASDPSSDVSLGRGLELGGWISLASGGGLAAIGAVILALLP